MNIAIKKVRKKNCVLTRTEGQFIIQTTVKEKSLRVISELNAKERAAFFFKYLFQIPIPTDS